MPFFRFHAVNKVRLAEFNDVMLDRLEDAIGCPREHIVLEVVDSAYISDRENKEIWPFVEVLWFERPLDVQDRVAKVVCEVLVQAGYDNSDVHFQYLIERNYYENGQHC